MSIFDDKRLYRPREVDLVAEQTLAKWRCLGSGPAYLKIGGRIFYAGSALNAWIDAAERGGTPEPQAA